MLTRVSALKIVIRFFMDHRFAHSTVVFGYSLIDVSMHPTDLHSNIKKKKKMHWHEAKCKFMVVGGFESEFRYFD